ncbi:MAG: sugar ABC transporter permease, partial [Verrucomicrobia bacterium]|nr:sugar ABC transporter permease [Verrucomicrobiota bacterium]
LGGAAAPGGRRRRLVWVWILLAPALLTIVAWQYFPLARGSLMALLDYRIMGGSAWVGLDNFGDVLWDPEWWFSVWNSLRYSLLVIALTFLPPVGLAILLQEIPRGRVLFRVLFYLPAVLSGLVVTLLWKTFYDPTERGWLNALLLRVPAWGFLLAGGLAAWICLAFARRLVLHRRPWAAAGLAFAGLALMSLAISGAAPMLGRADVPVWRRLLLTWPEPVRWLADSRTSMLACVLPMLWAGAGPGCLIYLAALKGVPDDLYEAAEIDGAGFADKILFVVVPVLRPLLTINFIGVFIGAWLHAGGHILAMTGGAAGTEVAELHIFYKAFVFLQFGPATAMAWVLGSLLIGFTIQQLRMISRLEFRAAGADR